MSSMRVLVLSNLYYYSTGKGEGRDRVVFMNEARGIYGHLKMFPCRFADDSNLFLYFNALFYSLLCFKHVFFSFLFAMFAFPPPPPLLFLTLSLPAFPLSYCSRFCLLFTELPPLLLCWCLALALSPNPCIFCLFVNSCLLLQCSLFKIFFFILNINTLKFITLERNRLLIGI